MTSNSNLNEAQHNKNDEFYTRYNDIEQELQHYESHFKGKIIYCNCDDPYQSNFVQYFINNFNRLGLKEIISTCYAPAARVSNLFKYSSFENNTSDNRRPLKLVITNVDDNLIKDDINIDGLCKLQNNEISELNGNGDFRSKECLELLLKSDIIVTNPPFSLFRDYTSFLFAHDKQFLIIGNINAITYTNIFSRIMEHKLWLGYNWDAMHFDIPTEHDMRGGKLQSPFAGILILISKRNQRNLS